MQTEQTVVQDEHQQTMQGTQVNEGMHQHAVITWSDGHAAVIQIRQMTRRTMDQQDEQPMVSIGSQALTYLMNPLQETGFININPTKLKNITQAIIRWDNVGEINLGTCSGVRSDLCQDLGEYMFHPIHETQKPSMDQFQSSNALKRKTGEAQSSGASDKTSGHCLGKENEPVGTRSIRSSSGKKAKNRG